MPILPGIRAIMRRFLCWERRFLRGFWKIRQNFPMSACETSVQCTLVSQADIGKCSKTSQHIKHRIIVLMPGSIGILKLEHYFRHKSIFRHGLVDSSQLLNVLLRNVELLIRGPQNAPTFEFRFAALSSPAIWVENWAQEVSGLNDHPKWLPPFQFWIFLNFWLIFFQVT